MTHTIISIGFLGFTRNYLNISREEAIARYLKSENQEEITSFETISEVQVVDEWYSYDNPTPP